MQVYPTRVRRAGKAARRQSAPATRRSLIASRCARAVRRRKGEERRRRDRGRPLNAGSTSRVHVYPTRVRRAGEAARRISAPQGRGAPKARSRAPTDEGYRVQVHPARVLRAGEGAAQKCARSATEPDRATLRSRPKTPKGRGAPKARSRAPTDNLRACVAPVKRRVAEKRPPRDGSCLHTMRPRRGVPQWRGAPKARSRAPTNMQALTRASPSRAHAPRR